MKEAALAWLHKQLKQKNTAMYNALRKPNVSEDEVKNIDDAIEIIEYMIKKVEETP